MVPLQRGERLLVAGHDTSGAAYAATDRALLHRHDAFWRRIGWEHVDHIGWCAAHRTLTLATPRIRGAPTATVQVTTSTPLLDLVRERVAATIVITSDITLDDGTVVRIVGRRVPGTDDVNWVVIAAEPIAEDQVAAAIRALRSELGLPVTP